MPCTLKDVASLAGVSTATASRVVNGAENVSHKTRTEVLSAISRLQYCPNSHAAELGRANGGIPRKLGIRGPAASRTKLKVLSNSGAGTRNTFSKIERLRLLEDETCD